MNAYSAPEKVPNHLAWAIISTLLSVCSCCGFLGLFSGIGAIIFAAQVNTKLTAGDIDGARKSSQVAKILCWVTTAFFLLALLYWIYSFATLGSAGVEEIWREAIENAKRNQGG